MKIIGAGLSGLIAAHAFPRAEVLEATPAPSAAHAALLRFRSDAVSHLTGIEFKRVEVHKGIWSQGAFRQPSIRLANLYSHKTVGRLDDRSIWNLDTVTRYIAPENLYEQLLEQVRARVQFGSAVERFEYKAEPTISTIPLPTALDYAAIPTTVHFARSPITVARYRVKDCDVYQTVYFPDAHTGIYRASLTGSLLIVEFMTGQLVHPSMACVLEAFGLDAATLDAPIGQVEQRYGKIASIDDTRRKQLLFELTQKANVYSLGRFAVWKNILLDDVVHDIGVIRRMMGANIYDKRLGGL